MGDENVPERELFGGEAIQDRLRVEAGVEQRRVARDFVPDEVAIHDGAVAGGGEDADFAPLAQIFRRGQPAVDDAFELGGVQAEQW